MDDPTMFEHMSSASTPSEPVAETPDEIGQSEAATALDSTPSYPQQLAADAVAVEASGMLRVARPTSSGGGPGEDDTAKTGLSIMMGDESDDSPEPSPRAASPLPLPRLRPTSSGGGPGEDDTAKTGLSIMINDEADEPV